MRTIYSADELPGLTPEARAQLQERIDNDILAREVQRMAYIEDGMMAEYENDAERQYNRELLAAYGFDPDTAPDFFGEED